LYAREALASLLAELIPIGQFQHARLTGDNAQRRAEIVRGGPRELLERTIGGAQLRIGGLQLRRSLRDPSFELLIDESELALGRFLLADVAHHDERHRTLGDLNRRHVNFGFERLVGIGPFEGPLKDRCALALQRLVVLEDRLSAAHTVRLNVCRYLVETLTDERLLLGNAERLSRLGIPLDDPPVLQQQDASERAFE